MSDKCQNAVGSDLPGIREAVCIHTKKSWTPAGTKTALRICAYS